MSTQFTYENDHISLLCDSTTFSALIFYQLWSNLKGKYHIRRKIVSKKTFVHQYYCYFLFAKIYGWSGLYNK